jgi:hypothetical protein
MIGLQFDFVGNTTVPIGSGVPISDPIPFPPGIVEGDNVLIKVSVSINDMDTQNTFDVCGTVLFGLVFSDDSGGQAGYTSFPYVRLSGTNNPTGVFDLYLFAPVGANPSSLIIAADNKINDELLVNDVSFFNAFIQKIGSGVTS